MDFFDGFLDQYVMEESLVHSTQLLIKEQLFPPAIYSLLVVYLTSFYFGHRSLAPCQTVANTPGDVRLASSSVSTSHSRKNGLADKRATTATVKIETRSTPRLRLSKLLALLAGLPSPTSTTWSLLTAAINIGLAAVVADVVYRGPSLYASHDLSFARTGYVSDTSARILLREPNTTTLPIFLSYRNTDDARDDGRKSAASIFELSNVTDFTVAITVDGLRPDTRYEYVSSTNHSGAFVTAPAPGHRPGRHRTAFTFLSTSCILPRFPYHPWEHPLGIPGFRALARWLPELQPQFMLFLGDFIYADVPRRAGTDLEHFRREYRMVYRSPDWPAVSRQLPWIHVLDDHEIANDWDRNTTGIYSTAIEAWGRYQASVNPPPLRAGTTYYSFTQGPASFFMLDTRRYRSSERAAPADAPEKTMLGAQQLADLLAWLATPAAPGVAWKIVASSVPLTKNWRFNSQDTWAGYLVERRTVLEGMWDVGRGGGVGVVVLSGDRHEFAATSFPPPVGGRWPLSATVHEFSTSPLSQFYLPRKTYKQLDEEDVMIKYLPRGNSKFGAITIESQAASDRSLLTFRLFVDGVESWTHTLTTPPPVEGAGRGKDERDG
ncbi:MAG: hypothetical protein M1826_002427 [Phylliscum demangeonii]|nr:MAG: hypothetical protein M1826_002427 [Phylliscum demangeonii]